MTAILTLCIIIQFLKYHLIQFLSHLDSGDHLIRSFPVPGLALGKLLHDCPDLVEKNQKLTRLVRRPDMARDSQWLAMAQLKSRNHDLF